MRKVGFLIAFISVLTFFACSFANAQETKAKLGSFVELSGPVKYDKGGSSGYSDLSRDEALNISIAEGDKIMTGDATTGEALLSFGARISIEAGSEMEFRNFNVRINRGGTWINFKPVKDQAGSKKFMVNTPVGTIGIKGTTFGVFVDPEAKLAAVQVTEGAVSFENDNKETVEISAGNALKFTSGEKEMKPFAVDPQENVVVKLTAEKKGAAPSGVKPKDVNHPFKKFRGSDPK